MSVINAERIGAADYFAARLAYDATPNDLKPRIERGEVVVLDVRDKESFGAEHIPGARNVPLEDLHKEFASLSKDKTVVTYCWNITCHLATKAALELAQKGFKTQELVGGIDEWKKRGMPVERK
ncbi:MAG TPA: rhodanese-like domain-containing protein [Elusimicrobiota bacterium]|jgi:ArsR family transcriptional regulator|nr:rhodanese-like domain-containing protein [Elusimicrobiota bacterium]